MPLTHAHFQSTSYSSTRWHSSFSRYLLALLGVCFPLSVLSVLLTLIALSSIRGWRNSARTYYYVIGVANLIATLSTDWHTVLNALTSWAARWFPSWMEATMAAIVCHLQIRAWLYPPAEDLGPHTLQRASHVDRPPAALGAASQERVPSSAYNQSSGRPCVLHASSLGQHNCWWDVPKMRIWL